MINLIDAREKYGNLLDVELELEARYKSVAENNAKHIMERALQDENGLFHTHIGQRLIGYQMETVTAAMKTYLEYTKMLKGRAQPAYYSILKEIMDVYDGDTDKIAELFSFTGISCLINTIGSHTVYVSNISQQIISEIFDEVRLQKYIKQMDEESCYKNFIARLEERKQQHYRRAYATARMAHDGFVYPRWTFDISTALGATIVEIIICSCDSYEYCTMDKLLSVTPSQNLLKAWSKNEKKVIAKSYKFCPMVIPPRNWENYTDGGYYGELTEAATFLRLRNKRDIYSINYIKKLNQLKLENVRKAVNAVQSTPWRINKKVLDVVQKIMAIGGGIAGLPLIDQKPAPAPIPEDADEETVKEYKKIMTGYYRSEVRRKSIALRTLANIRMAEEFKNFERIYFPCNLDFRGRLYSIVPNLNFQGDDLAKALLEFADAPACQSDEDWQWLCIEGANLAGVDKVSYEDRVQWVKQYETEILAVAEDPLANTYWCDQDCPLEFLAWCFEYSRAVTYRKEHKTLKGFVCGINVAFDGTCSGLQHFSAMLRDPVGGKAVNLVPGDKPSDIYGIVAEKVKKVVEDDAMNGTQDEERECALGKYTKIGTKNLAQIWLAHGITRKTTKRCVMTVAYGSKEYGFKEQLLSDIIKPDIDENGNKSIFSNNGDACASYLAKLIWKAVGTTVISAVEGMKWLQECARLVTKNNQVVCWTTSMGLPVQQAYMEVDNKVIRLRCAGKIIRLYCYKSNGNINNRAQAQAVAPNFIHSCDAAHLQLTICNCYNAGIKHFAMIHDSYGAPLAQAQTMYDIVRKSFIQMYTENDVLKNFKEDMESLTDKELPKMPKRGKLDLDVIKFSKYIFS